MQKETYSDLINSSHYIGDAETLQSNMSRDGYIFVRNLIDSKKVERVKNDIIKILKNYGYVKDEVSEPIWSSKEANPKELQPQNPSSLIGNKISNLKSLRDLYLSSELIHIFEKILGGKVSAWTDNPERVRTILPGVKTIVAGGQMVSTATPTHQDHFFFRLKGHNGEFTEEAPFYTAWIPLSDIDELTGGLTILKNSHQFGFFQHYYRNGELLGVPSNGTDLEKLLKSGAYSVAGNATCMNNSEWIRSNYKVGDAFIFHRLTLHRGLPNISDKIRLSADFRYQKKNTPTTWKSKVSLEYVFKFKTELRANLDKLGIKGELADKIFFGPRGIDQEGPNENNNKTIEERIKYYISSHQIKN